MSAKVWLGVMAVGSVLVVALGSRSRPEAQAAVAVSPPEKPWLSREAAAQIVGEGGGLGPMFANVELGGPAPAPEERARIAAFARANDVVIDLDVSRGTLHGIRFEVTYGGCCGYEAAEVLALRAQRPSTGGGCTGGQATWLDDWALEQDGVHLRANVNINRVRFHWQRALDIDEVLARADGLLGASASAVAAKEGKRWSAREAGKQARLEVPYLGSTEWTATRFEERGLNLAVTNGRITEVSMVVKADDGDALGKDLRARWGRPRAHKEAEDGDVTSWHWTKPDRVVEAQFGYAGSWADVVVRAR